MDKAIKTRIEEINSGKVPSGYKKTKVGIFPVEWKEKRFNTMFSRLQRKNEECNTNVLTISAQYGLINQGVFFNKEVASDDKSNYYLINKGEWAYNKSYSSGYPFGAIKRLEKYEKGIVSPLYICFSQTQENKCPDFYLQYFENGLLDKEIKAIAQEGARNHGLLNMGIDDFFNIYLIAPPIEEQEKIAEILKTQDRVIELKEKLLREKQREKKYLMQQLLTGKIRLKGFPGEWEKHKIGDYLTLSEIIANPNINKRITVRLHLEGIYKREIKAIEKEEATVQYVRKAGQFIYGKQNFHNGAFGIVPQELDGFQSSSDLPSFNISGKLNSIWFYNYCAREDFYKKMEISSSGTGSKRTKEVVFLKTNLFVPSLQEQNTIAEIITTKDREIALIKQQIESEKQKKKALMQLLLSGIVRVS